MQESLSLLIVATKAPCPPVDGGRVLLRNTVEALAAAGCRPTLVAPVDPSRFDIDRVAEELSAWCLPHLVPLAPHRPAPALLRSALDRSPFSIARHSLRAVRREVALLLAGERFDLVHAEQLQALPQAEPAFARGVPVVMRAHNVESDLWKETARRTGGARGRALALEAGRLARWEGKAVRRVASTLALSAEDAGRLRDLAGGRGRVWVTRAPFPGLPAASGRLAGEPAVVVLGSQGWLPNDDAAAWFLAEIWPRVKVELPGAVLHLFGSGRPLQDSAEAFAHGAILAVPLRIGSGIRIKVLEAWARGVPVVGTPTALSGLEVEDGREALVAGDAEAFARAIARLHREPELAGKIAAEGWRALLERHAPARTATELLAAYREAIG